MKNGKGTLVMDRFFAVVLYKKYFLYKRERIPRNAGTENDSDFLCLINSVCKEETEY